MKKSFLALAAVVCLLLTACSTKNAEPTEAPAPPVASIITTHPDGTVEKMEQIYDENGVMVKADHYSGEKLVVSYNVECDKEGRVTKMADLSYGTGISMEYTYNDAGKTEKIQTMLNGVIFFTQRYTYNDKGEKSTYREEDLRNSGIVEYKYIYEEGVMRWEEYYENEELLFSWEYSYNEAGERASGTQRDGDFAVTGSREYAYENGVTTVTTYDADGAVRNTKTIHYDENGTVVKETFTENDETTVTEYTYRQ